MARIHAPDPAGRHLHHAGRRLRPSGQVTTTGPSVSELVHTQRLRLVNVVVLLLVAAAAASWLTVNLLSRDQVAAAPALLVTLVLPIVFWQVRAAPVVLLAFAATGIERFRDPLADNPLGKIPLFSSFSGNFGVSGAIV